MNLFVKLANARMDLKTIGITKSGANKYAGYSYYELKDLLPHITKLEKEYNMISLVSFGKEQAELTIVNSEEPSETITFTSPMSTANLKGCHEVQNLGAVETYIRRYLYLIAYEIVEPETLDRTQGKEKADVDLNKLAVYLKKDVSELTEEDIKWAEAQKKGRK